MSKFKVGQKVKLNPETKPYTFTSGDGETLKKSVAINEEYTHIVHSISYDGDVYLVNKDGTTAIQPRHLLPLEEPVEEDKALGYEDAIELRKFIVSELGIEHADRFQEVYEWITGEK